MVADYGQSVFINCPFDQAYQSLFYALVFAVHDCGFLARSALEVDDASTVRIERIMDLIESCQYGIHDISRTELSPEFQLPRFNMPLELGIFLGAKRFGDEIQAQKCSLILDREPYRYQKFCSDIAGQDIKVHDSKPDTAVVVVRDWLANSVPIGIILPGGKRMADRLSEFYEDLPILCQTYSLTETDLTFVDFRNLIMVWLDGNPW